MDPNDNKTPDTPPEAPEVDLADAVLEGVEAAGGEVADDSVIPDTRGEPGADGEADPDRTASEQGAPEAKEADHGKPPEAKPDAKPDDKPAERDEAVEKEIKDLGLKGRTEERFRELTGQVKELAPIREALDKAGIKDVAQLPQIIQSARERDEFISMVQETGATPEQYGQSLDYLGLITRAANGDMDAAKQAYEVISKEQAALAQVLGIEVPGVHDPLAEHKDLQADVENGDLSRERALEIARSRAQQATGQRVQQQRNQQQEQTRAQQQAEQQGIVALQQWEAGKLSDPAYAAIRPALDTEVAKIRQKLPPGQWVQATEYACRALMAEAAARKPKPPVAPLRPGPTRPVLDKAEFDDPVEAMMAGIQAATPG